MHTERHIKLICNGHNQILRIPREFELPGVQTIIRKQSDQLIIEPVKRQPLLELLATLQPFDEDFPRIEELPIEPVDF
jgi:antitoxin VapB